MLTIFPFIESTIRSLVILMVAINHRNIPSGPRCLQLPAGHGGGGDNALKARERRGCMAATRRRRADRQARRGKRRLTGGPHSSSFSELNLLLDENISK
jgi:hypothetical protein